MVQKPKSLTHDQFYMRRAIELASIAGKALEVPVGALVVENFSPDFDCDPSNHPQLVSRIRGEGFNQREGQKDPLAHAEILAISKAANSLGRWRLTGCTLYVTLEPCLMCAGSIINSRIERVVFGANDPKAGAVISLYKTLEDPRLNHRPEVVGGILGQECSNLLKDFFKKLRQN